MERACGPSLYAIQMAITSPLTKHFARPKGGLTSGRYFEKSTTNSAEENQVRHVYFVLSLGIIALGAIHIAATPRFFPHLSGPAVWFASGGLCHHPHWLIESAAARLW